VTMAQPSDRVRPYDFRTPEGLDRSRVRMLNSVLDAFSRLAGGVMTGALRMPVHVKVADIRQIAWEEFTRDAKSPAHLIVFTMAPLPARSILYIPLDLAMAMVDVRLSGSGSGWYPQRALTEIEEVLLAPIVDSLLSELSNAIGHYLKVDIAVTQKVADTDVLQAVIASGFCVAAEFEVRFGESATFVMVMCLPFPVARPIVDAVERAELAAGGEPGEPDPVLESQVLRTPLELAVRFDPVSLTAPEIAGLVPGDVILLRHRVGRPLTLVAGNLPRMSVLPTAVGHRLAAVVVDPASVQELLDTEESREPDWPSVDAHDGEENPEGPASASVARLVPKRASTERLVKASGRPVTDAGEGLGGGSSSERATTSRGIDLEAARMAAEQLFSRKGTET